MTQFLFEKGTEPICFCHTRRSTKTIIKEGTQSLRGTRRDTVGDQELLLSLTVSTASKSDDAGYMSYDLSNVLRSPSVHSGI